MILKPDTSRMIMAPFTSHNTVVLFCDILDAVKKSPYERDPRGVAKKALSPIPEAFKYSSAFLATPLGSLS